MYKILYIQHTQFFKKNAQNYIGLTYTFLNESTKLYIFNLYKFSKNITNFVHSNTHTHTHNSTGTIYVNLRKRALDTENQKYPFT